MSDETEPGSGEGVSGETYRDREVVGSDGASIGKVADIYVDDDTGAPAWVAIASGRVRSKTLFAPLRGSTLEGERITLAFDRDAVRAAPTVDGDDDGYLSPEQEERLDRHYASAAGGGGGEREPGGEAGDAEGAGPRRAPQRRNLDGEGAEPEPATAGGGDGGGDGDGAMTRSEEKLQVRTERVERERVRLRKHVVTEQVTQTVPVSHEEVRIEREPITDDNRDEIMAKVGEDEHEVILYEERPVVTKEVVPVERVRMVTETVHEQTEVSDELRKERIERG